jgi:site-specific DNA-cytosine methylase
MRAGDGGSSRSQLVFTELANPLDSNADGGIRLDLDNDTYVPIQDTAYALMAATLDSGRGESDNLIPTLGTSHGVDNLAHAITAPSGRGYSGDRGDGSANLVTHPTLSARDVKGTNSDVTQAPPLLVAGGVRRLTPRECERLMGWPDDHTRYTADGREIADSHRYRMVGNGVVATVAEWIGHRLGAVDRVASEEA